MTSKSLFWVRCKENNKRRIWVWVISILAMLFIYPAVMTVYLSRIQFWNKEGTYQTVMIYKEALQQAAADAVGFQPRCLWIICLLAVLIGIQGFSYLYDRKKVDMYHSMPIPFKSRYVVIYWNGIVSYLLPYLMSVLIALVIAMTQGALCAKVMAECGYAFLMNLLFFLTVYHMAILAVMVTGNKVITGFLMAGLLFFDFYTVELYNRMKYTFFERADNVFTNVQPWLSPIYEYDRYIYELKSAADFSEINKILLPVYAKWAVFALVLGGAAYWCYRKRPAEASGKTIAFPKIKPFLKVIVAVMAGVTVCHLVYDAVYYKVWITVLAMVVGTVLACGIMEVIYEFDIRAMIKHLISTGVSAAIVLIIFCIYQFDLFGYDTYVPDADKVESVAISTDLYYQDYFAYEEGSGYSEYIVGPEYYKQNMFLTDTEAICELARKSQETDEKDMEDGRQLNVLYRMKSGREIGRKFYVDYADVSNEELLNRVFGNEEFLEGEYQLAKADQELDSTFLKISYSNGTIEQALSPMDAKEIKEAWLKDMERFDFSLARHERPCGKLEFLFTDSYNVWNMPVYDYFENTISYLEKKEAYYPVQLNPEHIASITVTNYHYSQTEAYDDTYADTGMYAGGVSEAEAVAVEIGMVDMEVTKTFSNPEEIAEIVAHIYPSGLEPGWHSYEEMAQDYEITIAFKPDVDYPYGVGYYYYEFFADEVPDFVVEATAN